MDSPTAAGGNTVAEPRPAVSGGQRALAWLSIGCAVVLSVVLISFTLRNVLALVAVVVGLAIGGAGGWWLVTERPPRRWFGLAGALAGLAVIVIAVVAVAADADRPLLRVAIVVVLFVVMIGAARTAIVQHLHALDDRRPHAVAPPGHPVLICNPWSGGGKVTKFRLAELANELGVETVMLDHGLDLEQLARDAIARGRTASGWREGTARKHWWRRSRSSAVCRSCAFRPAPGTTSPQTSVSTARIPATASTHSETRSNGGSTTPRSTSGSSSTTCHSASTRRSSSRTATATRRWRRPRRCCPNCSGAPKRPSISSSPPPTAAEIDGAFLIQVSNNPYALDSSIDAGQRRRIDTGELGVIALSGTSGKDAATLIALDAVGERSRSRNWHEFTAETFEVRSRSGTAFAGVDGEALDMTTPLVFRIHPGGLRLLVPEGNLEAAERRLARNASLGELLDVARGRP